MDKLLSDIETYLSARGWSGSYFGRKAAGNTKLVDRLKAGGEVLPSTEAKIRAFMSDNPPPEI